MLIAIKPVHYGTYYDISLEMLGLFFIIGGFGNRLWCTLYIGGRKNDSLLQDGPYSICRNPLYVGSILAAFGVGMQTEMLTFAILSGSVCWIIFHVVVKREEKFLHGKFGARYQSYIAVTPRFWPKFSIYKDDFEAHSFRTEMLWNTFRDGLVLLTAIPITETVELAHRAGLLEAVFSSY